MQYAWKQKKKESLFKRQIEKDEKKSGGSVYQRSLHARGNIQHKECAYIVKSIYNRLPLYVLS